MNQNNESTPKYPGKRMTLDGSAAVVIMETLASDAAGAYPITPSTQMGEGWSAAVSAGKTNVFGRRLLFFEPEGEHAAAAVTAGMSLCGLRSTNFSSGQGIAYMHESLYAAVGKRLTYVLNVACRAMTKHSLNVHAGHDDYHSVDDTGFFQLFAKNVEESADLNLITHRVAELSLNPGICAQDGFLTSHVLESALIPEAELVKEYLGDPDDEIECPTPAQKLVFGETRRRIPELYDFDNPAMLGTVQNQDSYMAGVAAQRPFYFDHIQELADIAMAEYNSLTGKDYRRAMGYRLEDAEYVLLGQGSVVENAEAVVDHLRKTRGIKAGVLNLTMFRPFPTDLITQMLRGKKAVTVLERLDQPLAVDAPLLRELRSAMGKAMENGRVQGDLPWPGVASIQPNEIPEFFSGSFGMGSRDLQPNDIVAAVDNMLPDGIGQRIYYLGIDFIRKNTRLPKLQIWQDQLLEAYPNIENLALTPGEAVDLLPEGSTCLRVHSIGGWGAITMGKNLAQTAAELGGLHIKANPKYGSEKKGQPTTFYATLAPDVIRTNCELKNVDAVLSPDPNVFHHSNPLSGLRKGGILIIQTDQEPAVFWNSLPRLTQQQIRDFEISVHFLDGFKIAAEESSNENLRYRMQGTAFMGAFFKVSPLAGDLGEKELLAAIRKQLDKKFGHLGERVVEDNLRVIRRGYEEIQTLDLGALEDDGLKPVASQRMPTAMEVGATATDFASGGRFWEQVGHLYESGEEGIADPHLAVSVMPAASASMRDMTHVRFEIPEFVPQNCTGCSQCWTQCPDSAIPGVVNTVEEVLNTGMGHHGPAGGYKALRKAIRPLAKELRALLGEGAFSSFGDVLDQAWAPVLKARGKDEESKATLTEEFGYLRNTLADFPLSRTLTFFEAPEAKAKNSGGLLSITVNPETCKGCMICVDVCPDEALIIAKQTDDNVSELRKNWNVWMDLPTTGDNYVKIANLEEGIGTLPSLLLKKENYLSMVGGDGACMGCGEKTALHLVLGAVTALQVPRVANQVEKIKGLIKDLDAKARELLTANADLKNPEEASDTLKPKQKEQYQRLITLIDRLEDLKWRYEEGPTGHGRSAMGFTNSTGCSSVWASTYPYNPYPFPWVNHLFQDAPSIAIGIFEGQMRKMAEGFADVRQAEMELKNSYKPEVHGKEFAMMTWEDFTDEEFFLCPPLICVGGDGAMLDIGFQNLSRMLASGLPIRVVVLDTQVYSNTGGQACTSGFTGQISDMAMFGDGQQGKTETRKEMSLLAMAHRNSFVLQSSQATASHLIGGVLRGLQTRRPAIFVLNTPCPVEHGTADDSAVRQSKMALEGRAFPNLEYNPDEGDCIADHLSLDGNPAVEEDWPTYSLNYLNEDGEEASMDLPFTVADWAITEGRFGKHFRPLSDGDDGVVFHEYLALSTEDREGQTPFLYMLQKDRKLRKMSASGAMVALAEERRNFWNQLKEMAGERVGEDARALVEADAEEAFDQKMATLKAGYEQQLAQLRTDYPKVIARKLAEGLIHSGDFDATVGDLLAQAQSVEALNLSGMDSLLGGGDCTPISAPATTSPENADAAPVAVAEPEAPAVAKPEADTDGNDDAIPAEIASARCTSCNECININSKIFAYNDDKQAYIADASAGTFQQIVKAAEACPVAIITPGTPLNPKEKGVDKWIARAEPFN